MKIECVLKRDKGTKAIIDGLQYHFEPLEDGAHVAEIEDRAHIDAFLNAPEAYKVYHGALSAGGGPVKVASLPQASAPQAKKASGLLNGSSQHQPQYEIGGATYALGDIVRKAFEKSGLTEDDWNALDEDDVAAKLDIMLDDLSDASEAAQAGAPEDERATLAEAYKAKFGKAPHYRASVETIKTALAE